MSRYTISLILVAYSVVPARGGEIGGFLFDYVIYDVPDFDQLRDSRLVPDVRVGLPTNDSGTCTGDPSIDCEEHADCGFDEPCLGTGGAMYCAPTTAMNWLAYLANHGYPQVAPGSSPNWQSQDEYNRVGTAIGELGNASYMKTSANTGTDIADIKSGLEAWLAPQGNMFAVAMMHRQGTYSPRLGDVAKLALDGQLVILHIGFYNPVINRDSGLVNWVRSGGHYMSMTRARASGNPIVYELGYQNPSVSDSTYNQYVFIEDTTTLTPTTAQFDGFVRTQDRLDDWTKRPAYFDGYVAIVPKFLIASVLPIDPPGIKRINPVPVPPSNKPLFETIPSPTGTAVVDAALWPTNTDAVVVTSGGAAAANRLWRWNLVTDEWTEIPTSEDPGLIVTGRDTGSVYGINRTGDRAFYIDESGGLSTASLSTPAAGAIAYDDSADELLVIKPNGELWRIPADFSTSPTVEALPAVIAPTGGIDIAVGPAGEEIWVSDAVGGAIYRLTYDATGTLVVSDTISCCDSGPNTSAANRPEEQPEKLNLGGTTHLVVLTTSGSLIEFEPAPVGGWQLTTNPLFSGYTASGFIEISQGRSNYDPATMSGTAWRNVLPTFDPEDNPDAIPAVNTWGIVVLSLLVLSVGSAITARRPAASCNL